MPDDNKLPPLVMVAACCIVDSQGMIGNAENLAGYVVAWRMYLGLGDESGSICGPDAAETARYESVASSYISAC